MEQVEVGSAFPLVAEIRVDASAFHMRSAYNNSSTSNCDPIAVLSCA